MAKVANISSLAALISMSLAPLYIWLLWPAPELIGMQILVTLLLIWRHRSNIENLIKGEEDAISETPEDGNDPK
jgi:glycerol-3-phosphate acyltransferase PlsY